MFVDNFGFQPYGVLKPIGGGVADWMGGRMQAFQLASL
jgi:hypothetical protein